MAIKKHKGLLAFILLTLFVCIFSNFTLNGVEKPHAYILKYPPAFGKPNIPLDNPLTIEGVWLGRLLFYDTLLSINGKMSCGTCHKQELSFTDGRKVALGVHGDTLPRNTMSIVNLAWSGTFFWDGRVASLEEVAREPIVNPKEMGGKSEEALVSYLKVHPYYPALFRKAFPQEAISIKTMSKAMAQFMRTVVTRPTDQPEMDTMLVAAAQKYQKLYGDSIFHVTDPIEMIDSVTMKRTIFETMLPDMVKANTLMGSIARVSIMQCKNCHMNDVFGGQVMTKNEKDSFFKVPSILNTRYTGPYFHDGRFKTMREVLQFYNDNMAALQKNNPNRLIDLKDIVKFTQYDLDHADELMEHLNDPSVNTDPAYSNPFLQKRFSWYGVGK